MCLSSSVGRGGRRVAAQVAAGEGARARLRRRWLLGYEDGANAGRRRSRGRVLAAQGLAPALERGERKSLQAFLTGCSAGGLATYIHCDAFRALLPQDSRVKCLSDGGFFLDVEDISRKRTIRAFYNDVVVLQDLHNRFLDCDSNLEPGQCFFPREVVKNIGTPVFVLNAAYDAWQVQHVLAPQSSDPQRSWVDCRLDIHKCSANQLEILQGFRKEMHDTMSELKQKRNWGMYINSCFVHCQSLDSFTWHSPSSPRVNNRSIAEAVGDWFFDRREVKEIDCEYPCNPTCHNLVFANPFKG